MEFKCEFQRLVFWFDLALCSTACPMGKKKEKNHSHTVDTSTGLQKSKGHEHSQHAKQEKTAKDHAAKSDKPPFKSKHSRSLSQPNLNSFSSTESFDSWFSTSPLQPLGNSKHRKHSSGSCCCGFLKFLIVASIIIFMFYLALVALDSSEHLSAGVKQNIRDYANTFIDMEPMPGQIAREKGYKPRHPVVFIPGIISTKLEVWESLPCASQYFRQSIWGSSTMVRSMLLNKECWLTHLALDVTGLDPAGIKLRPFVGMAAADYFIGDYWLWSKLIENLAHIGYCPNNMYMAAYDWRLSFQNLEFRDGYFTRLKAEIEILVRTNSNHKVMMVTHSMGGLVGFYFLQWVQSPFGGRGGVEWIDTHLAGWTSIGTPLLGVPKAVSSLLSGEMRDTADLNSVLSYMRENVVSSREILGIFRSFGSLPSMLPKGGDLIWGDNDNACDDLHANHSFGLMVEFPSAGEPSAKLSETITTPLTDRLNGLFWDKNEEWMMQDPIENFFPNETCPLVDDARQREWDALAQKSHTLDSVLSSLLPKSSPAWWWRRTQLDYSWTNVDTTAELYSQLSNFSTLTPDQVSDIPDKDRCMGDILGSNATSEQIRKLQSHWSNPLACPLPASPDFAVYVLYGTGISTERGYAYRRRHVSCDEDVPFQINNQLSNASKFLQRGIKAGDGDGTVPLLSLGYVPKRTWKTSAFNPANAKIQTKEYPHEIDGALNLRSYKKSGDHVDILGNYEMIADVIDLVSGQEERFTSRVGDILKRC